MSQARTFSSFLLIIFSQIIPFSAALEPDPECADWFKKSKITAGTKDCEMGCATLMVDMATFNCPNQCEDLCRTKTNKSILESLIFYPGLTPAEKALIARNPKEALTVYRQMRTAETATLRNFPDQNVNDESDAFRHFVWAALLTKELGRSKAKQFLEAHENDPDQQMSNDRWICIITVEDKWRPKHWKKTIDGIRKIWSPLVSMSFD